MHRRFFVRPAGLLGFAGFAGMVGFAALRKPSSPAMAVEGGEEDGAADNSRGSTMYRMKTSLGSFEWLRRDAIRNRPSWPKGEAKSPSMAQEEKKGERLRLFEASKLLRHLQETLDRLKAILSREEALLYEMKSKGFGNPQIWCPYEDALSRSNEKFKTVQINFVELKRIQESLEAVITEQMKTSPESSHYHDLEQRIKKLEQQNRVCLDNLSRAADELVGVFCETKERMDEVTSSSPALVLTWVQVSAQGLVANHREL